MVVTLGLERSSKLHQLFSPCTAALVVSFGLAILNYQLGHSALWVKPRLLHPEALANISSIIYSVQNLITIPTYFPYTLQIARKVKSCLLRMLSTELTHGKYNQCSETRKIADA